MPLESADIPAQTPSTTSFQDAMLAGLTTPAAPAPAETPQPPEPSAPVETPAAPAPVETPAAPVDQIPVEDESGFKTPLDDVDLEPVDPAADDPKKDKVDRRIEQLKEEIKTAHKPRIAELEQTVAQRDARLKELEGAAAELEQLRQQKAEFEAEMSITRLERTPEYKSTVAEPLATIATRATEIAEAYGIDTNKLFAAIEGKTEKDRRDALKEATSGLEIDADDAFEIRTLIKDAQPLFAKREELYNNADKAIAELTARKEAEESQQALVRAEDRKKATDLVAKRVSDRLPFFKEFVEEAVGAVKETDFATLSTHDQAYNALVGAAMPKIVKQFLANRAELDNALDELASYKKSSPRVDGGLTQTGAVGEKPKDFQDAMLKGLGFKP